MGHDVSLLPRRPGQSLQESQQLHDKAIGKLLQLKPGMHVADIDCGVGGPLVTIAWATGAKITGINYNHHQIRRGKDRVRRKGLEDSCAFLYADYMNVPLEDDTFDAAYSFEAVCHAPNKSLAFRELFRLLRPGAAAAIVDWCLTDSFDGTNARHNEVRDRIERNNATPELLTADKYVDAVLSAGFDVVEAVDQQATNGHPSTPWYMALQGRDVSFSSFARIPTGRALTAGVTRVLERLGVAPAGSFETAQFLNVAADALIEAGELGIFTPSFLVHAHKPA